ncbi:MAG: DUF3142 domain-containing protein [Planctomycetota bacterium]
MNRRSMIAALAVCIPAAAALAGWVLRGGVPRAAGPLPHEAYVWQRRWNGRVKNAALRSRGRMAGLTVLGAEVGWRDGKRRVVRVSVPVEELRPLGVPVGVALRVGPPPERAYSSGESWLPGLAAWLLAEFRGRGLRPSELQLDFDCASGRLDDYARWVRAVRARVAPVPVVITALPCWLKRSAFADLVRESDGFVLQVHSLERPRSVADPVRLCDPRAARRWVERAARLGVPFRVALPTYGYLVAFDRKGGFAGLSAEGPAASWAPGASWRHLRADPAEMAGLVRGWERDRPEALSGITWYRLPVEGDRLNWSWEALCAVTEGRTPRADLRVESRKLGPGLREIQLVNRGEAGASAGVSVSVSWRSGRLVAADALGGFSVSDGADGSSLVFEARRAAFLGLSPGKRLTIGWLRMDREGEVDISVCASESRS